MPSGTYGRGGGNFTKESKTGTSPSSPTASGRSVGFKPSEKAASGGYGRGGGNYVKRTKPVATPVTSDKSSSLKSTERKPSRAYGRGGGGNYVKKPKSDISPNASDKSSSFKSNNENEKLSLLKRIALAMSGGGSRSNNNNNNNKSRVNISQPSRDTLAEEPSQPSQDIHTATEPKNPLQNQNQNQDNNNSLPPSPNVDTSSSSAFPPDNTVTEITLGPDMLL